MSTYLPGAALSVRPLDGDSQIVVQAARSVARLLRSNILLCRTVVHVIDTVSWHALKLSLPCS